MLKRSLIVLKSVMDRLDGQRRGSGGRCKGREPPRALLNPRLRREGAAGEIGQHHTEGPALRAGQGPDRGENVVVEIHSRSHIMMLAHRDERQVDRLESLCR